MKMEKIEEDKKESKRKEGIKGKRGGEGMRSFLLWSKYNNRLLA